VNPARPPDPLADGTPLIRRVYGYVAFRMGGGPDAEDVTSDVFERAVRYRNAFDPDKGTPTAWLLGIAQRCVDDALRRRATRSATTAPERGRATESEAIDRMEFQRALGELNGRDRDLLALRYGVGLSTKQIARALDLSPGTVDVAVHRARARLSTALGRGDGDAAPPAAGKSSSRA
jgi:RNA polymerase sigma factor (sigma-70 family)